VKLRSLAAAGLAAVSLAGCGATTQVATAPVVNQPSAQASVAPASAAEQAQPAASPSTAPAPASQTPVQASPSAGAQPSTPPGPPVAVTPASIRLGPLQYIRQTLNNCGPASIAEVLRYWGVNRTQDQVQAVTRPDGNTRGMWPYGVPAYVASAGMNSLMGVGGTPTIVKALVANGFPVIVAQWVSAADHTAHYREIEGFDDNRQVFISTDSYLGPNHEISYSEFDQIWARGNQRFMVIYPRGKQPLLNAVMQSVGWSKATAYQADLDRMLHPQSPPPDLQRQGAPGPQFRGSASLGKAWDHIQLGQIDLAQAEIAQAKAEGANPWMVDALTKALTLPF
jgi:predicted double-glycine peptidase